MTPRIPLSSPDITEAEIAAVTAVLRTSRLSLGPELDAFERAMADSHGIAEAVAVSSGTAGLHLALIALGIGPGAEVILPSFAFIAVANAVHYVGATPVFVDIDPVTLNLDPELVEGAITPKTRALLIVHTFGVPAQMDRLLESARTHRLAVIEDACEAIGGEFDRRRVGTFGDLAVFGFYPNKQITTGEGGCILARDRALAERLRSLRNQGRATTAPGANAAAADSKGPDSNWPDANWPDANWFDHREIGYNYRLSELACALGRVQLSRLGEILDLRRSAAARYAEILKEIPGLELPPESLPRLSISWFVYVVRLPQGAGGGSGLRDRVQAALAARGIATARYFAPIHLQPAWANRPGTVRAELPRTEAIARRTLAIPFFNRITREQQREVAEALRSTLMPGQGSSNRV